MLTNFANKNVFDSDVEQVALRSGFGEGLLEAGKNDDRIVGICADLLKSTKMHLFANEFPERFIETGIMEQHMASLASGMAAMGKIPFISSYSMFNPGRNWEQIRTTICYNDVPVKVVGSHAGVSVGPDGGSHQAIEDIAIMRPIPNLDIIVPADATEAKKATLAIAKTDKPAYLRLAREKTPLVTNEDTPFKIGRAYSVWESENPRVAIIAAGPMVYQALLSAKALEDSGVKTVVLNSHTIKPLDEETILKYIKNTELVVSAETHQITGGLGGAIAELLAKNMPKKMIFIGVQDRFGQSGTPEELMREYGLDSKTITSKIVTALDE